MLGRIILVLIFACFAMSARADSTVFQLLGWLDQKDTAVGRMASTYLTGAMTTLVSVNAILESRNQQKIYCQPPASTLTVGEVELALRLYLEGSGQKDLLGKQDALVFLPFVLQTVFPCKQ